MPQAQPAAPAHARASAAALPTVEMAEYAMPSTAAFDAPQHEGARGGEAMDMDSDDDDDANDIAADCSDDDLPPIVLAPPDA
mmetsp:Transcript_15181/g.38504  ORF Transcript_15181/g.38504 Transcript_15181/m.38504 type:complete len:82 (+) Transcript_15181:177-422(+)